MSVFLLIDREDELIDSYRPQTDNSSPTVTQANTPDENAQHVGERRMNALPDPSVGGVNASGILNGFSTGIRSLFNRQQPFSGAVATPPATTNPVQGDVGNSNRSSRLYAGVMNQLVQYTPGSTSYAAAYVGAVPPASKGA